MKKLLYFGITIGVLLFGLVVIWGAFVLYQRLSLLDNMTYFSVRLCNDFVLATEESSRKFQVIEVVCKRKDRFNATLKLQHEFLEGEREDGLLRVEAIDFPERPTRFSNGIWMARYYVLGTDDGYFGVFDTMPTLESVQKNPDIEISLVPYCLPQKNIVWYVTSSHNIMQNITYREGQAGSGGGGFVSVVYGIDDRNERILFFVGGCPLADTRN